MNTIKSEKQAVVTLRRGIEVINKTRVDRLTIAGWYIVKSKVLKPWRIHGFKTHSGKGAHAYRKDPVFDPTKKPTNMPADGIVPMLLELRRPVTPNADISLNAESLEIKVTNLQDNESYYLSELIHEHYVASNKGAFQILLTEYNEQAAALQMLRNFCGVDLFKFVSVPAHIKEWRRKHLQTEQPAADMSTSSSTELAEAMCSIGNHREGIVYSCQSDSKGHTHRQHMLRSKPDQPKVDQKKPERSKVDQKKAEQTKPAQKDSEPTRNGIPAAAWLSKPQRDLILLRLSDVEVACPAMETYPLRRGRLAKGESEGIISFSAAQLYHINKIMTSHHYEVVYNADNDVYALRNLHTGMAYAFTKRDWAFVQLGKECKRFSNL